MTTGNTGSTGKRKDNVNYESNANMRSSNE